jgi:D-alanine-D-alanine ligase
MSITVNPDWWKRIFDEVYLLTDARSVGDEALTRREIDVICNVLPMRKNHKILDLCCGHGRHSFELCRRDFKSCTLLDYSSTMMDFARKKAVECGYLVEFIQGDARNTDLASETFDHVLILGNSLGYIQERDADTEILAEAFRLLRPEGWLLVDVANGLVVKNSFTPNAWHEIGEDTVVCRQRELRGNILCAREIVLSRQKGLIRDQTYAIHLYDSQTLADLLRHVGFSQVKVHTNFSPHQSKGDYGFMDNRMIVTGQKRIMKGTN